VLHHPHCEKVSSHIGVELFMLQCMAIENSHKLKHRKFQTNVLENFFTVRVMEHWNRLPERLWSLLLWRCSSPTWMPTCAT